LTVGDIGMSRLTGTSRQPSTTWPSADDRALDLFLAGEARGGFLGQEHHADAVLAGGRQAHALRRHLFAEELVRNLDQDAGAVALQRVGTDRAPVVEVLQDLEALQNDVMCVSCP
jgi:hypothetical protein